MRILRLLPSFVVTLLPASVLAVGTDFSIDNPLKAENLGDVLTMIASGLIDLAIPVAVGMYIWSGILWMTSRANPATLKRAKDIFLYTTLGLVVIFIGGGFIDLIKSVLNLGQ